MTDCVIEESDLRLASLEKRMLELQTLVKTMDQDHVDKFDSLNREIESLKSGSTPASTLSPAPSSISSSVDMLRQANCFCATSHTCANTFLVKKYRIND